MSTSLDVAINAAKKALEEHKEGDPNIVAVSDVLFMQQHKLFDQKARFVYTGRKDGTNRKWIRLRNKRIVLVQNQKQFLIPLSLAGSDARPLTKFAERTMQRTRQDEFQWIYGEPATVLDSETGKPRKNVIGYISKGKRYMNTEKPCRSKVCDNCHQPNTSTPLRVCSGCETFVYCSTDCQRAHWPSHKNLCRMIRQGVP